MRKEILSAGLFITGLVLLVVTSILVYREWGPADQKAAIGNVYYLSPSGNDTNLGTESKPWKTFDKANSSVSSGDTVILLDGVYPGYVTITKAGTTWKAANKHKAIFDGGFSPSSLKGTWDNIVNAYNTSCNVTDGRQVWSNIITINSNNITLDGLFLRNSCGRGLLISESASNSSVINSKIDWTMIAGVFMNVDAKGVKLIDNEFTRITFSDEYAQRVAGYCQPQNTPLEDRIKKYCVNISMFISGEDIVMKNNVIAFGRGEIAVTGAKNLLFEDNMVVSNKNNFYSSWSDGVIARNNIFWSPDSENNPGTHWEKTNGNDNNWRMSSRNEEFLSYKSPYKTYGGLKNMSFYNNLIVNTSFQLNGYHKDFATDTTNIYFGHNTLVTGPETIDFFKIDFSTREGASADAKITALIESNIFDVTKDQDALFNIKISGNDSIKFRNNLLPGNVANTMKGEGDVYTTNSGLVNPGIGINYKMPAIGAPSVDMVEFRSVFNINNYKTKQTSPAINKASKAGAFGSIQIPPSARTEDFLRSMRDQNPDIGALEYGASDEVLPTLSNTPAISPSGSIAPTIQPSNQPTLIPSVSPSDVFTGNVCGKADVDGDGRFNITDFAEFARAYGIGSNTCADKDVDYGPCGGRDVNKDGKLNIADFGGAGIGFAQRYFPKTSCAL
jgi:hypothetical protein